MRILERYILGSVLATFISCFCIFFFLYIIIDLFAHLDVILKQGVGLGLLQAYYLSFMPVIFTQVAPFSCMLATLYTFSRMNRENEIIAMRASGMSIYQITRTVFILGFVISLGIFIIGDRLVPKASLDTARLKERIENEAPRTKQKEPEILTNLSVYGAGNRLFVINKFYVQRNAMEGITVLEHNQRQEITRKIWAQKGEHRDGAWHFFNSITYSFDTQGQIIGEPQFFEEEVMPIPETPRDFVSQRQHPEYMNIAQLNSYIGRLRQSGAQGVIKNLKIDLYQRFASPLASLIMIILSIPFALKTKNRASGLASLGLALVVGFLYYILNAVSVALGKADIIPGMPAVWLAHAAALAGGLYLIKRTP